MHLGSPVGREEPVALRQEPLERIGLGMERLGRWAIARGEYAAGLAYPCTLGFVPVAHRVESHSREERGYAIHAAQAERGEPARGVDAEEPDSREAVGAADVGAHVEL